LLEAKLMSSPLIRGGSTFVKKKDPENPAVRSQNNGLQICVERYQQAVV
jgi:hypothetical protein